MEPPIADPRHAGFQAAVTTLVIAAGARALLTAIAAPTLLKILTDYLLPHRTEMMVAHMLGLADLLKYMGNGAGIRQDVRRDLESASECTGRFIALGNSLGGVILFDVLHEMAREPGARLPDLFVTVGSQSSLLQTIGALPVGSEPTWPWLNIFCHRDFLGFVAGKVWETPLVTDFHVDLGVGFPDSHGQTYFQRRETFEAIRKQIDRL